MRNLFIALVLSLLAGTAFAAGMDVNRSSFTATVDTLQRLPGSEKGSTLAWVVVSSPSANGTLTIYDSQNSATNQITPPISLTQVQAPEFHVRVSSGITYSTTGNSTGVTIIWR